MRTLLISLNSQFIHSSLAPWYLKAACDTNAGDIKVMEYTINDSLDSILAAIYREKPDAAAFSCYIWNISYIYKLIVELKKVLPQLKIILGGPEVSYDAKAQMEQFREIDFILAGEGELSFNLLLKHLNGFGIGLEYIDGLAWRKDERVIINKGFGIIENLDAIPTPYTGEMLSRLKNRIVYYESSRGCPFHCSYCLSSASEGVRYFSMERVKADLTFLINAGVKQVKFVDRTFNCNKKRAGEIFSLIIQSAKCQEKSFAHGIETNIMPDMPNFHFEAAADLFDDEMLELLSKAPDGLIQFEIGVQTTNEKTLEAILRKTDMNSVIHNVEKLKSTGNIHLHLDLITGLPYEDYGTFMISFNRIYAMRPNQLQLGFLKMLKGTKLRREALKFDYKFKDYPPYEILYNKFISFDEILELKGIEEIVERYYNSGRFQNTLAFVIKQLFSSPFDFFRQMYLYNRDRGFLEHPLPSREHYNILAEFLKEQIGETKDKQILLANELLKLDYLASDNTNNLPAGITRVVIESFRDKCFEFLKNEQNILTYLPQFEGMPAKQIIKHVHFEAFCYNVISKSLNISLKTAPIVVIFDYTYKDRVTNRYRYFEVPVSLKDS